MIFWNLSELLVVVGGCGLLLLTLEVLVFHTEKMGLTCPCIHTRVEYVSTYPSHFSASHVFRIFYIPTFNFLFIYLFIFYFKNEIYFFICRNQPGICYILSFNYILINIIYKCISINFIFYILYFIFL